MLRKLKNKVEAVSPLETSELLEPRVDFYSNREALVDGSVGILEYNSETVRLNCKDIILKFSGADLSVKAESIDKITVYGNIFSMEFCDV